MKLIVMENKTPSWNQSSDKNFDPSTDGKKKKKNWHSVCGIRCLFLVRKSHRNDLGPTLQRYAARIYDRKENEKLYRKCGGKLYNLMRLYLPLSSYYRTGSLHLFFPATNLFPLHDTSLIVRDTTTCINFIENDRLEFS